MDPQTSGHKAKMGVTWPIHIYSGVHCLLNCETETVVVNGVGSLTSLQVSMKLHKDITSS